MKLLVQPGDGVAPLVKGITAAKKSVEIVIFRFDRREIELALAAAVTRGVPVRALIAHTNRAGEESLRKLEMRLLEAGVNVARTADDLVRYHGKLMVIDRRDLYVLAFNLTYMDIEHSRSFGVITKSAGMVREAVRLFEADSRRRPYEAGLANFVVSPENSREQLSNFIRGAKREIVIYDPKVSDPQMIDLLEERCRAGVTVRIIGRLTRHSQAIEVRRLSRTGLHTRTMVRDGKLAFIGSQSLRAAELDARRETGIIFRDAPVVSRLLRIFHSDWESADLSKQPTRVDQAPAEKVARKVAKAVAKGLPDVAPVLDGAVREVGGRTIELDVNAAEVQAIVKGAIKAAVKEAVMDVVAETAEREEKPA